jgi:hypothetical protein
MLTTVHGSGCSHDEVTQPNFWDTRERVMSLTGGVKVNERGIQKTARKNPPADKSKLNNHYIYISILTYRHR